MTDPANLHAVLEDYRAWIPFTRIEGSDALRRQKGEHPHQDRRCPRHQHGQTGHVQRHDMKVAIAARATAARVTPDAPDAPMLENILCLWVMMTPFGVPVVPEEFISSA